MPRLATRPSTCRSVPPHRPRRRRPRSPGGIATYMDCPLSDLEADLNSRALHCPLDVTDESSWQEEVRGAAERLG
jgi:hypothetical protein